MDIVKLLDLIVKAIDLAPHLPGKEIFHERMAALTEMLDVTFVGPLETASLQMHQHCGELIDIRGRLISDFEAAVAASSQLSGMPATVNVSTSSASASTSPAASTDVQQELQQGSSSFPRDIHRTDRLSSHSRKKSRKR